MWVNVKMIKTKTKQTKTKNYNFKELKNLEQDILFKPMGIHIHTCFKADLSLTGFTEPHPLLSVTQPFLQGTHKLDYFIILSLH
jgi:hypothetical protein